MAHPTTSKHFEVFKKEVLRWLEIFGLKDWDVSIEHKEVEEDSRAICVSQVGGQLATISLSTDWDIKPTDDNLQVHAFHEVCELLLSHMDSLARERTILPRELEVARHSVIRVLENVLFPKY